MMRKLVVLFALLFGTLTVAQGNSNVLVDQLVRVRFGAPADIGDFHFQILTDGTVRSVDNKNQVTVHARLEPSALGELLVSIQKIQDGDSSTIESTSCLDAPSTTINVFQYSGQEITIYSNIECQRTIINDPIGNRLVKVIMRLDSSLRQISKLTKFQSY